MATQEFWLKFSAVPHYNSYKIGCPKCSVGNPACGKNDIAVKMSVDIPDSYFKLPEITGKIVFPEVRGSQPVITIDLQQRAAQLLKDQMGMHVTFEIEDQEKNDAS